MINHPGIFDVNAHSRDNFGMCYASKSIQPPPKRVVKKSIPFRNGALDFSLINGEDYFDERSLTYVFETIGDTPIEVSSNVDLFTEWLESLTDTDIWDDEIPFFHWHGGCDSIDVAWDEDGLKAIVTATFVVYPFRISDDWTSQLVSVGENTLLNEGRPARLYIVPSGSSVTIAVGPVKQTFYGETLSDLSLPSGMSTITVTGGAATVKWCEERI